jgi:hypothetical protein
MSDVAWVVLERELWDRNGILDQLDVGVRVRGAPLQPSEADEASEIVAVDAERSAPR